MNNIIQDEFKGRGSQKGYMFKKIKREGNVAIYSKEHRDEPGVFYYEAVVINKHNGYKLGGVEFPPGENYPSDNQFGLRGWCSKSFEIIEKKYKELLEWQKNKQLKIN